MSSTSALYLVATPIGNLEDVTLRVLRILSEVDLIAAENTGTVRKLLARHNIRPPRLLSYTEGNKRARTPAILTALGQGDVALVSEAGTPGISDPGVDLVAAAVAAGHRVEPLPGPSAVTAALAASGLPTRRFHFEGFLPRTGGPRRRALRDIAELPATLVLFEAPHRIRASLGDVLTVLGDREIAVCRELTKLHEEIFRGTVTEAIAHFSAPRGEFTLVIAGRKGGKQKPELNPDIDAELIRLRAAGVRARQAVQEVVEGTGVSRQLVYRRWLELKSAAETNEPVT
ncbi:MAG: 16S rRNA (cytidine(1402)-2'-O)-methyltransferase [Chloroflexi bacterium]|nr:16S rRNA (cytidine(1402)-2'-O)-methyltransferase [Chloroflexota bacterium]